jgi:hypothetical protein
MQAETGIGEGMAVPVVSGQRHKWAESRPSLRLKEGLNKPKKQTFMSDHGFL